MNRNEIIVSSPYIQFNTNELMITVAKAVYVNNEFVGVIGTDMTIRVLEE